MKSTPPAQPPLSGSDVGSRAAVSRPPRAVSDSERLASRLRLFLTFVAWAAVGVALCLVPLFNVLGYESCLVLALLASLFGVHHGVRAVSRGRGSRERARGASKSGGPTSGRPGLTRGQISQERADTAPFSTVFALFLRASLAAGLPLLVPLLLLLLNGIRVRNCSYAAGFSFFALLPLCSTACGVGTGLLAALLCRSRARAYGLGYALLGLSLLWSLLRFLASPAIFSFDPFFGYYPGALYDEEISIGTPFLAARALHLATLLFALSFAALRLSGESLTLRLLGGGDRGARYLGRRRGDGSRFGSAAASLLFGALSLGLFLLAARLGCRGDVATLQAHLHGELRTQHFVLRYRPGGAIARDIRLLAREHELRYQQLKETLGVEPDWRAPWILQRLGIAPTSPAAGEPPRVVSYLFDTVEEKRRLMGAAWTYIAKPWRREMYLHHEGWPHPVLRHELAHIFAGAAGDRLLRLSVSHGVPQPGMIEGMAVAADWRSSGDLDPHQTVRAMRQGGLDVPLPAVFGLGFYRLPASRAYALAGSFCRFLLLRRGAAPLLAAYRRGGSPADFAVSFGVPFPQLEREYRAFIDEQPLSVSERGVAQERLRRPAVFHKVCAHELALRKQQARGAAAAGDLDRALSLLSAVCRDDPGEPQHQAERLEMLYSAERFDEAAQVAGLLLSHPGRTPVLESRALVRLGDLAVLRGDLPAAQDHYQRALALPESENAVRQIVAKLAALTASAGGNDDAPESAAIVRTSLLRVLVGEPLAGRAGRLRPGDGRGDALMVYLLRDAILAQPDLALPHYILGRLLYERGAFDEAQAELGLALAAAQPLPDERFAYQARLLRGQAALLAGRAGEAVQFFTELLAAAPAGAKRLDAQDMLERAQRWDQLAVPNAGSATP